MMTIEEVYNKYHYSLMWETRKFNLPEGLGEELVNDVFMLYIRYYDPTRSKETTFLHFVLRRLIKYQFIRGKIKYVDQFEEDIEDLIDKEYGVYDEEKERRLIWIEDIVSQLPDTLRETTRLYFYDGIPQKEISKLLGVNYSTIKSRIHMAKKFIKNRLVKKDNI